MKAKLRVFSLIALFACVCFIGILTSKEKLSAQSVEKVAMVDSVGLDNTAQASITFAERVINGDTSSSETNTVNSKGENFADAENSSQNLSDKQFGYSFVSNIVAGMPTAKKSLSPLFSYLCANQVLQFSSNIFISQGSAEEFISEITKKDTALEDTLENFRWSGIQSGYYYPASLLQVLRDDADSAVSVVPVIKAQAKKDGEKTDAVCFCGYAVVKNGRVACVLDRAQSRGVNFVKNTLKRTTLICTGGVLEVNRSKCRIKFVIQGGKVEKINMEINIKAECKESSGKSLNDKNEIENLSRSAEEKVKEEVNSMFAAAREHHVDIAGFKKLLAMDSGIKSVPQESENTEIGVSVNCRIEKTYNMEKV